MSLSLREKEILYRQLAELLGAGVRLPAAVERLATTARGEAQRFLRKFARRLESGDSVADAMQRMRAELSELERALLGALERTGGMDRGLRQLSEYFGAMAQARQAVLTQSAYPVLLLHLAVLLPNIYLIFTSGLLAYLQKTLGLLGLMYLVLIVCLLAIPLIRDMGRVNSLIDRILCALPLVGGVRRNFALMRFFSTYDMLLEAGVNVMDSMNSAGRASQSAVLQRAASRAQEGLREGRSAGLLLAEHGGFPDEATRTMIVAEETGQLDKELSRLTAEYNARGMRSLNLAAEWFPRLLYLGAAAYVGWTVVMVYKGYLGKIMSLTDSL